MKWRDYMSINNKNQSFTKEDLKDGMIVETENNHFYLKLGEE